MFHLSLSPLTSTRWDTEKVEKWRKHFENSEKSSEEAELFEDSHSFFNLPDFFVSEKEKKNEKNENLNVSGNSDATCRLRVFREQKSENPENQNLFPPSLLPQKTKKVLIIGLPKNLKISDFLGEQVSHSLFSISEVWRQKSKIKTETNEDDFDRSAVLFFKSQVAADRFFEIFHNRPFFTDAAGPVCYLLPLLTVCVEDVDEGGGRGASSSPPRASLEEIPCCPLCLERIDSSVTGVLTYRKGGWLAGPSGVQGSASCPGCSLLSPSSGEGSLLQCQCCEEESQLWVCLVCGYVGCGRFLSGHAKEHALEASHRFCLQLSTGRVWDYRGDVFVHRRLVRMAALADASRPPPVELPDHVEGVERRMGGGRRAAQGGEEDQGREEGGAESLLLAGEPGDLLELETVLCSQLEYQRTSCERALEEEHRKMEKSVAEAQAHLESVKRGAEEAAQGKEMLKLKTSVLKERKKVDERRANVDLLQAEVSSLEEVISELRAPQEEVAESRGLKEDRKEVERLRKRLEELMGRVSAM